MKKLLYIIALAFVTILPFSCTEEEVAPQTQLEDGGGGAADNPIIKNGN
jgi:hypothetical protein